VKIKTIDIKNFLALEQMTLNLQASINLIIGPNEAGKSSLRDGVQWALTGQARGFKTHQEQVFLIREGGKAAAVSITYDDDQKVSRRKTPKSPSTVDGVLPPDLGLVAILSDPLTFLSWPDAQRRETLFRLIPGLNPDKAEIAQRLFTACDEPDSVPFRKLTLDLGEIAVTKGFKAAENEAIAKRREAKRLREELTVEEPEQRATIGGTEYILPDIREAEVQEGLVKLRTDRDKLIQKRGKVEGEIENIPRLEEDLAELEKSRFKPSEVPDPQEIKDRREALEAQKKTLQGLQADLEAARITQEAFPQVCTVIRGSQVPCPQAGQFVMKQPDDTHPLEELEAKVQTQQEHVETLEKNLGRLSSRLKAHQEGEAEIEKLSAKIKDLKAKKDAANATMDLDLEIAAMDVRIKNGQDLLFAVQDFWRKKTAAETAQARIGQAEAEITLYDALAKVLAPEGIPSQLIKDALDPVNERLAKASAFLFPCGGPMRLSEDLQAYRDKTPFPCLSKSARFRAGICFQYALASLTEAGLLMIDEADILDPLNRALLIEFLLEISQEFDTILVFATSDEAKPSPVPEIQVWWLEEGRIAPVIPELQEQAAG
jgi:hypothetical protein